MNPTKVNGRIAGGHSGDSEELTEGRGNSTRSTSKFKYRALQGPSRKAIDAQLQFLRSASSQTFADHGIDIPHGAHGKVRAPCPQCAPDHRNPRSKCLSVDLARGLWCCHRCGWGGRLDTRTPEQRHYAVQRRQSQLEIDHALIVVRLAESDRARGLEHSQKDRASILQAVALLEKTPSAQRKFSEIKQRRDMWVADLLALHEGAGHVEADPATMEGFK